MPLILVGGGSRSGKSSYALRLARERGARRAFVATAQAFDDEMRDRIARHRQDRDATFETFEEPVQVAALLRSLGGRFDVVVVDCLTLWLSNLLLGGFADLDGFRRDLVEAARQSSSACVLVTNEVGCGIVPENALARQFRDLAGSLNQQCAAAAEEAYWMAFGIALRLK